MQQQWTRSPHYWCGSPVLVMGQLMAGVITANCCTRDTCSPAASTLTTQTITLPSAGYLGIVENPAQLRTARCRPHVHGPAGSWWRGRGMMSCHPADLRVSPPLCSVLVPWSQAAIQWCSDDDDVTTTHPAPLICTAVGQWACPASDCGAWLPLE